MELPNFLVGSGVSVPGLANFCSRPSVLKSMQHERLHLSRWSSAYLLSPKESHFFILLKQLQGSRTWSREVFAPHLTTVWCFNLFDIRAQLIAPPVWLVFECSLGSYLLIGTLGCRHVKQGHGALFVASLSLANSYPLCFSEHLLPEVGLSDEYFDPIFWFHALIYLCATNSL